MMESPTPEVRVSVSVRTLLVLLAFGVVVALALLSLGTLISILLAAVLAFGLDPVVGNLVRRGWKRGPASLTVFAGVFVAFVVLVVVTAGPVWEEIVEFVNALPAMWDELSSKPAFQDILNTANADDTIANLLKELAAGLPDAASALLGVAGGIFGSVLSLVTLTFLALFLLMERPMITTWLFGFATPDAEERWSPVVENSIRAISTSLIGNLAISVVAATVAGVSALLLDLPFPLVLAVITGLLDLIPQVGATIAAVILTAVALTVSTEAAIIMVVVQLIYQQIENYVVYPVVYRTAISLSGFTTIVAVLLFGALLGVVGAILAVPFAAVVKTVLHEATRPRRERMALPQGRTPGPGLGNPPISGRRAGAQDARHAPNPAPRRGPRRLAPDRRRGRGPPLRQRRHL